MIFLGVSLGIGWEIFRTHKKVAIHPLVKNVHPSLAPVLPKPIPVPAPPPVIAPLPPLRTNLPPPVTLPVFAPVPPKPVEVPKTNVVMVPPVIPPVIANVNPPVTPKVIPPVVVNPPGVEYPRPVKDVFEAQIALARHAFSPGSIDGAIGSQTRAAIAAFQRSTVLPATGTLDAATRAQLTLETAGLTGYTVTAADLARLQPIGKTWVAKSQQTVLDYETILELVAEHAHANPLLIRKLNPGVDWDNVTAGTVLKVPDVEYPDPDDKALFIIIHLSEKYLEAFGARTNLLAHFPCSIAAKVEKRPVGELHVVVVIPNPDYTFNPEIFPESPEAQQIGHKLVIPPGPNNPVGVAWIGLDRPGYGMHGTPVPEQVGRTESHGCFRLANWDAAYMVKLVWIHMPVEVVP